MLRVPDFTKVEIDYIKANANFTSSEEQLFDLRNMEYTYERCSKEMNLSYSTIRRINKKMVSKIIKILWFEHFLNTFRTFLELIMNCYKFFFCDIIYTKEMLSNA